MSCVYVMSNQAFSGLLKIGFTTRSPYDRAQELSQSTGVPSKYILELIINTDEPEKLERLIHSKLRKYHYNKEFFRCSVQKCVFTIKEFLDANPTYASKVWGQAADTHLTAKEIEHVSAARAAQKLEVEKEAQKLKDKLLEINMFVTGNMSKYLDLAKTYNSIIVKHRRIADKIMASDAVEGVKIIGRFGFVMSIPITAPALLAYYYAKDPIKKLIGINSDNERQRSAPSKIDLTRNEITNCNKFLAMDLQMRDFHESTSEFCHSNRNRNVLNEFKYNFEDKVPDQIVFSSEGYRFDEMFRYHYQN